MFALFILCHHLLIIIAPVGGFCNEPGECLCNPRWAGTLCDQCDTGWTGSLCDVCMPATGCCKFLCITNDGACMSAYTNCVVKLFS